MAYREDKDLEFLGNLRDSDLNDLVHCIIYDKDGETRFSELLTVQDSYKRFNPRHTMYWKEIAEEIQTFGANGFVTNLFRGGKGVLYREVLTDVCKHLKVKFNKESSVSQIERNLMLKLGEDMISKMSAEEVKDFAKGLGVKNWHDITPQLLATVFQTIFRTGGPKSYQLTLIVANTVARALSGKGLMIATNAVIGRTASIFGGPAVWGAIGLWTVIDLAGPAYRVTVPAVIQVALLRAQNVLTEEELDEALNEVDFDIDFNS